jgi:hypothetical protein
MGLCDRMGTVQENGDCVREWGLCEKMRTGDCVREWGLLQECTVRFIKWELRCSDGERDREMFYLTTLTNTKII